MSTILRNLRFAVRSLARKPGFAATAILCLALGIGANTAIFSFVNAVLLEPLPYPEPDRLVHLWQQFLADSPERVPVSGREFLDYRERSRAFSTLAAMIHQEYSVTGSGEPEVRDGVRASAELFGMLGVRPAFGRTFRAEEDRFGKHFVTLLSDEMWRSRFAARPDILGEQLLLDGVAYTIIGVLPRGFRLLPRKVDLWVPLAMDLDHLPARDARGLILLGRLRPGITFEQATANMAQVARGFAEEHPDLYPAASGWGIRLVSLRDQLSGKVRANLLALFAAALGVLAIACINVANLLLARAVARGREMALRIGLGAGRRALFAQLVVEGLVLSLAGAACGALFAGWGIGLLVANAPARIPFLDRVGIDLTVLLFALSAAVLIGLVFGLAPILRALRLDLAGALRGGAGAAGESRGRRGPRHALIVAEVALTTLVLIGASLTTRSLLSLGRVDPGFRSDRLLTLKLRPAKGPQMTRAKVTAKQHALIERLHQVPGVSMAAGVSDLPIVGGFDERGFLLREAAVPVPGEVRPEVCWRAVTANYFETMSIPIRSGRGLTDRDAAGGELVAVIDELLARRFWPGMSPLGRRVRVVGSPSVTEEWRTVVGVVGAIRPVSLADDPRSVVYLAQAQIASPWLWLAARTSGDPASLTTAVRRALLEVDPEQVIPDVLPMTDRLAKTLAMPRFVALLFALFGGLALALALLGVYGVLAYGVAQRTRELAVRMAVGADRPKLLGLVIGEGMRLAGLGVLLGVVGALMASRLIERLLYGVKIYDPLTYVAVPTVILATSALAALIPAWRATRVAPAFALRGD